MGWGLFYPQTLGVSRQEAPRAAWRRSARPPTPSSTERPRAAFPFAH